MRTRAALTDAASAHGEAPLGQAPAEDGLVALAAYRQRRQVSGTRFHGHGDVGAVLNDHDHAGDRVLDLDGLGEGGRGDSGGERGRSGNQDGLHEMAPLQGWSGT